MDIFRITGLYFCAGSEAAWQIAQAGVPVRLYEMRPVKSTEAHHTSNFAELLNIDYDGNELLLSDIIGTDSDIVKNELEQSDQKAMFYEAFKDLSKREKEILMFRYGLMNYDELTQKDVAKMMGISQSYISRLEKKIIKKLRNKLNYNEIK